MPVDGNAHERPFYPLYRSSDRCHPLMSPYFIYFNLIIRLHKQHHFMNIGDPDPFLHQPLCLCPANSVLSMRGNRDRLCNTPAGHTQAIAGYPCCEFIIFIISLSITAWFPHSMIVLSVRENKHVQGLTYRGLNPAKINLLKSSA